MPLTSLLLLTVLEAASPKLEGKLKVIAWPGYLERGEADKAYDWVTPFEKATGCSVEVKTANTSDEMVALMKQPGFDLVTASGDASLRLVKMGRVQKIDLSRVPSWKTVDPRLQNAPWHTVDGDHWGVPYQWGPNVLLYDKSVFGKTPPKSWSVLFEPQPLPDGKSNVGRVAAYDGPIAVADAALYLMKTKPALGIKDPYELSPVQYAAVLELMRRQRKVVLEYWHDATAHIEAFKAGRVVASSGWPYQVNALKAEKRPIESIIPDEGCTGWADTTMLAVDAPHPGCAYAWFEWSLKPDLQAAVSEWFGSLPAVVSACQAKAPGGTDFCKANGFDLFGKILFWKTPELRCVTQPTCAPYWAWERDYGEIKKSAGPSK